MPKVLVACEESQTVTRAFRNLGMEAYSCDILPCSGGQAQWHLHGDVFDYIDQEKWDLMIAHPPCTYLSVSGMHWTSRGLRDPQLTQDALAFVQRLLQADIPRIALENPVSIISTHIRKPDQTIQPWMFGHDASKKTCLWLKNLPLLKPTETILPQIIHGRRLYANQTPSGQNKLGPSPDRAKKRSTTYAGIAEAMAQQWGHLL